MADSEEVSLARRALGRQLAGYRSAAGLSQHQLAPRTHYSRSTIANAEVGRQNAPRAFWQRADEVLGADGALLRAYDRLQVLASGRRREAARAVGVVTAEPGLRQPCEDRVSVIFAPGRPHPSETDEMDRRELLRLFSMAGALLALPETGLEGELIASTGGPDCPDSVDTAGLAGYATLNTHLWQVFGLAPVKTHLLPLVRNQLGVLTDGLRRSAGPARRQLCLLAADLFQLAGEVFFDGNRYTDAAHCYTLAATAGGQADAFDLWACALTRHAYLAVYECQFSRAAPMLEVAAALARRGDPALSTRYWIAAVQAETFAGLGDRDGCERALDAAAAVQGMAGTVHNGGWLRFDGSRLAEERGTCYVTLGRADLAESALTGALAGPLTTRRRAGVLTDLAMIGVHRRDTDQVLAHAEGALSIARHTGSGVIGRRLRSLQSHLGPLLADTQIQRLAGEISALAAQPTAG